MSPNMILCYKYVDIKYEIQYMGKAMLFDLEMISCIVDIMINMRIP